MDTVTISLKEYNRLRDFEKEILKDEKIYVERSMGFSTFRTKDQVITEIAEANESLVKAVEELRGKLTAARYVNTTFRKKWQEQMEVNGMLTQEVFRLIKLKSKPFWHVWAK